MNEVKITSDTSHNRSPEELLKAVLAASRARTAAPPRTEKGYIATSVTINKENMGTALGITIADFRDGKHPVIYAITKDGVAANQGGLLEGDAVVSITAAVGARIEWTGDCSPAEMETISLLKNAIGEIKIGLKRNGVYKMVVVHRESKGTSLGLVIQSNKDWDYTAVREVDPKGPCAKHIKLGDNIVSIEAATEENCELNTELIPNGSSRAVIAAFLKTTTEWVRFRVHRLEDSAKRWDSQASLRASSEDSLIRQEEGLEPVTNNDKTAFTSLGLLGRWRKKAARNFAEYSGPLTTEI